MYKLAPFSYSYSREANAKKIFSEKEICFFEGETIAVTGVSGGGKTTFLKLLKGIIPEYSFGIVEGELLFKGHPLTGEHFTNNLKSILYLFQNPFTQLIYPTTEEEFFFSMENFNFTKEKMEKQKKEMETQFRLQSVWGKKTTQLSNGECQRLVLSSLLSIEPDVLLLDEPTAFLDPEGRAEFYQFIQKIKGKRLLIIIDHHLQEIAPWVDRVIHVSAEGKIEERPKEMLSSPKESCSDQLDLEDLKFLKAPDLRLSLLNIKFFYDKRHPLLSGIQGSFVNGEIIAIKGKNGVGKSTLFKLLAGVLTPKEGSVILAVGKKELKNTKIFSEVGFIFQNPEAHFFFDTVKEELHQSFKHLPSDELRAKILKTFFYDLDLNKSPFLLSEGEKRRLSILMTVFLGKSILFFDEPTFGQDPKSKGDIVLLMKELKKMGVIQVIISHDEEFIAEVADRSLTLRSDGLYEEERA